VKKKTLLEMIEGFLFLTGGVTLFMNNLVAATTAVVIAGIVRLMSYFLR
jgi:hypothetical protein